MKKKKHNFPCHSVVFICSTVGMCRFLSEWREWTHLPVWNPWSKIFKQWRKNLERVSITDSLNEKWSAILQFVEKWRSDNVMLEPHLMSLPAWEHYQALTYLFSSTQTARIVMRTPAAQTTVDQFKDWYKGEEVHELTPIAVFQLPAIPSIAHGCR